MTRSKRAYRVAYDGRPFSGFQRQPDARTVEGELFAALRSLAVARTDPIGYSAAGRTDAGVSALAQTVAFEAPAWCTPRAINAELPDSIRAWASAPVDGSFHATRDASLRTYCYLLYAPEADLDRARAAGDRLAGEHDFHNLTPVDRGTVREIEVGVDREGPFLAVRVSAPGFPRQLVRRLVTLLESVATGAAGMARIDRLLAAEPVSGPAGVAPAPPEPLVLVDVAYPMGFTIDDEAAVDARARFEESRIAAATRTQVTEAILAGLGDGG